MAALAILFATLSVLNLAAAGLNGSVRALVIGLADAVPGLACFIAGALP
ncbi:hypothetical protein [Methylobacterium soli]|nr:hypothetical protein [Methylobacterium soli]GJE41328.1 hypothetical protein AEGHOMDF_0492 [Methylobacterium soli]